METERQVRLRRTVSICIFCSTLILSAAGLFLLPDTVAVQWNSTGEVSGYMPRNTAVLVPVGVSLLCLLVWHRFYAISPVKTVMLLSSGFLRAVIFIFGALLSCTGIALNIVFLMLN